MRRRVLAAAALAVALSGTSSFAQETLTVWWVKGSYKAEDEALRAIIGKFEAKTGVKVELSQYEARDIDARSVAAVEAGAPPDVAYSDTFDMRTAGKWAFDGKLEDISDVIEPIRDRFAPVTIETARLFNGKTGTRAYYGFALKQQTVQIQYWKDMLGRAGFKENDIPGSWKDYWSFWCDRVQPAIRKATGQHLYGIGNPMGVDSTDSSWSFLTWADAYDVALVDDAGRPLVDRPKVREGLVAALRDYTDIYLKGCTPPSSTTWTDRGNEAAFQQRNVVMTHNSTISIVARWLDEANDTSLTREQRAVGRKAYDELIATSGFPGKPDGSPMIYRTAVKIGVIFEASRNKRRAREFVRFLLEEENLRPYVEAALGLWFPVTKAGQESPFWQADKHRKVVYYQFKAGTRPFEFTRNYRFALLDEENVWARAMKRVVDEKMPVEQAVDELIARIRQVAG